MPKAKCKKIPAKLSSTIVDIDIKHAEGSKTLQHKGLNDDEKKPLLRRKSSENIELFHDSHFVKQKTPCRLLAMKKQ